jgi:nitric oxide reductase large subunit
MKTSSFAGGCSGVFECVFHMLYLYGPDGTVLKIGSFLSELIVVPIQLYAQWANGIVLDWPTVELNHTQHHRRPYGITILRRRTAVVGSLCGLFDF